MRASEPALFDRLVVLIGPILKSIWRHARFFMRENSLSVAAWRDGGRSITPGGE
jgi:hypothetical protein